MRLPVGGRGVLVVDRAPHARRVSRAGDSRNAPYEFSSATSPAKRSPSSETPYAATRPSGRLLDIGASTPWLRRSTRCSKPSSSATRAPGRASTTSRSPSRNTSTGSTTDASTARSDSSHPSSSKYSTTGTTSQRLPCRVSSESLLYPARDTSSRTQTGAASNLGRFRLGKSWAGGRRGLRLLGGLAVWRFQPESVPVAANLGVAHGSRPIDSDRAVAQRAT